MWTVEHSMEHIGSHKRTYQFTSHHNFVWDQPNMHRPIKSLLCARYDTLVTFSVVLAPSTGTTKKIRMPEVIGHNSVS